ncbi:MAG: DNA-binding protein [Thauera sp.]|jgi:gp16 family phage-associated protein
MTRTPEQARAELQRKGITVSEWAAANGFNVQLVFAVLRGERQCIRGQSHRIAVALGLKEGEICLNAKTALEQRAAA